METNREPDIYVKMVLKFDEKPALAMAQIALRKTAVIQFPRRCDSVCTIQQAKRLTTQLDEVLMKGGFKFKGWLPNRSLENEIAEQEKPKMKLLQGTTQEKILGIDLAPNVWLHSSVGTEHRTGIVEITGLNPVEALIFSGFLYPIA